jgi:hypothetical protein
MPHLCEIGAVVSTGQFGGVRLEVPSLKTSNPDILVRPLHATACRRTGISALLPGTSSCTDAAHLFAGSEVTSFVNCPGPLGSLAPPPSRPDRGLPVAIPYPYRINTGGTSLNAGFKLVPPVPLATPPPLGGLAPLAGES